MANPKGGPKKPSKKKLKNIAKAARKMTPKAKKKAKKAKQIDMGNKMKASKRKAAELVGAKKAGKAPMSGDMSSEVSAVDKLFASIGESEEEEENAPLDDGSDESSAGAFHDVGGGLGGDLDDDEDLEPPDSGDEGGDAGLRHEDELKAIKEKDPEFYKFLVESDKALLDFQTPVPGEMEEEGEPGDDEAAEASLPDAAAEARAEATAKRVQTARKILTPDRLKRIQDNVFESFTACKAALNIYHTAVRSIENQQKEASDTAWKEAEAERKAKELKAAGEEEKKKPKPKRKFKKKSNTLEIDDEGIFSEVIEWSLKNLIGAFRHHAGKLRKETPLEGRNRKKNKKPKKKEDEELAEEQPEQGTAVDVRRFQNWNRLKIIVKIFWDETFFLFNQMVGPQMIEYLLRNISGPEALSWMWPFTKVRGLFIRKCISVWAQAPSSSVRLLSFLFLRNIGVMALQNKETTTRKDDKTPMLDEVIRAMVKGFAQAAAAGFSWRTCNSFKVMENCFVEMLRLDDATSYRLAYVCIRQLARILRNATIAVNVTDLSKAKGQATSMARGKTKKVLSDKQKKKRHKFMQATQGLIGWPFIRAVYLWTKAVGSLPSLKELAYPLSMVIMGAVKSQINKIQMFPFLYHCLLCQNRMGAALGAYVPISSHLIKSFEVLNSAIDKAYRKRKAAGHQKKKENETLAGTKAAEVEVLTHLGEAQRYDSLTLDAVGSNICFLLSDHMGLLSQSPAFPELVSIVLIHVRKLRKHCGSEALRKQLTNFIQAAEETSEQVRVKREALTEAPPFKKLLLFEADTALAKQRATLTKRKAEEERQRIEAETREEEKAEAAEEKSSSKKKRAGRREREAAEEAAAAAAAKAAEAEAKPAKKKRKAGKKEDSAEQMEDKVEEMSFSSDDDKD